MNYTPEEREAAAELVLRRMIRNDIFDGDMAYWKKEITAGQSAYFNEINLQCALTREQAKTARLEKAVREADFLLSNVPKGEDTKYARKYRNAVAQWLRKKPEEAL